MAGRVQRFEGRCTEHVITAAKSRVHSYGPHSITAILCAEKAKDWRRDRHSTEKQPSAGCVATH